MAPRSMWQQNSMWFLAGDKKETDVAGHGSDRYRDDSQITDVQHRMMPGTDNDASPPPKDTTLCFLILK